MIANEAKSDHLAEGFSNLAVVSTSFCPIFLGATQPIPFAICSSKILLYNSFNLLKPFDLSCFLTSSIVFLTPDAKTSEAASAASTAAEPLNEGLEF